MRIKIPTNKINTILIGCIIVLVVANMAIRVPDIKNVFSNLNLIPKQETFTEMYFANSSHLPTSLDSRKKQVFQFTIHNVEGRDMQYSYEVTISGQNKQILDKGELFVKNGQSKTISEVISIRSVENSSEIVVSLINQNQEIHFWVNKNNI